MKTGENRRGTIFTVIFTGIFTGMFTGVHRHVRRRLRSRSWTWVPVSPGPCLPCARRALSWGPGLWGLVAWVGAGPGLLDMVGLSDKAGKNLDNISTLSFLAH